MISYITERLWMISDTLDTKVYIQHYKIQKAMQHNSQHFRLKKKKNHQLSSAMMLGSSVSETIAHTHTALAESLTGTSSWCLNSGNKVQDVKATFLIQYGL